MGRMYPEQRAAFFALPLDARLRVEDDLIDFLLCTHARGYVAVDFYDGSVLYDRAAGHALFCDVDCFARKPFVNRMGRLWGSSRFMAPEEFTLGAQIDERTNVYLAGCMAFALAATSATARAKPGRRRGPLPRRAPPPRSAKPAISRFPPCARTGSAPARRKAFDAFPEKNTKKTRRIRT